MKKLSKSQTTKIRKLAKKGLSQKAIALAVHIRKQRVSTFLRSAKLGRRVASPFWSEVDAIKKALKTSHKEATSLVRMREKWVNKRWMRRSKKLREFGDMPVGRGGYGVKETIKKRFMEQRGLSTEYEYRTGVEASGS